MATFTKIESVTVGSGGVASVSFSSIPATYTNLVIKGSMRMDLSSANAWNYNTITFNGSSSSYTGKYVSGNNTSILNGSPTAIYAYGNTQTASANIFSNFEIYVPNYTSSSYKSVSVDGVTEQNGGDGLCNLGAYLWSNTSAITSITITPIVTNVMQYSTFTLYGITAA